jgi:hypothetical protein
MKVHEIAKQWDDDAEVIDVVPATVSKDELAVQANTWAARAAALRITDAESCVNASQLLKSIKHLRSGVAKFWTPHIEAAMETKRKADAARKSLVDERDRMDAPLVQAETVLKRGLLAFEAEQEQRRQEEERALQAAALARAEAATLAAAAALELQAGETGDAQMLAEAEDILAQPIEAPVVSVASYQPKVAGVTYRDAWKVHPTINVRELAAAVAAGTVAPNLLTPNLVALGQMARATEGTAQVPGVKFFNDRTIAARA